MLNGGRVTRLDMFTKGRVLLGRAISFSAIGVN